MHAFSLSNGQPENNASGANSRPRHKNAVAVMAQILHKERLMEPCKTCCGPRK